MTEPLFPDDLANDLVSGRLGRDDLPTELRGMADLFAAARQAPTGDELSGMDATVTAFAAALPATVAAPEPARSVIRMFNTRIPKRAAILIGATLLTAGTAAAAAGGAIPSPFSAPRAHVEDVVPSSTDAPTSSDESTTTTVVDESTSTTLDESTSTTDSATSTSVSGRTFGHCTAWFVGHPKSTSIPGFRHLQDEADAAGMSVDDYCHTVLGQPVETSTTVTGETSVPETSTVATMPSASQHGNGKGNSGKPGKP